MRYTYTRWERFKNWCYVNEVGDKVKTVLIFLGIIITVIILIFALIFALHNSDEKKYNNGICECGGHYEFTAVGGGKMTSYVFECDKCHRVISIGHLPENAKGATK